MKIIIRESQSESIKRSLNRVIKTSGFKAGFKAVGGMDNFITIMFDGDVNEFNRYVVNYLIDNTKYDYEENDYFLFDRNISIHVTYPAKGDDLPYFSYVPSSFTVLMSGYGFISRHIREIWELYSKYIVDLLLKNIE